jgi:quinol-cytochrome oxidoreductase complex cytochrome b subunit
MKGLILWLASVVNEIHDQLAMRFGIQMTDKELHFWVIGLIGMVFFLLVYLVFKWINQFKFKTTIVAFIYTFTLMVVLVFAIEIQQAITNRGNMEFADAAMGLWGFIVFFFLYSIIVGFVYSVVQVIKKSNVRKNETPLEQPIKRYRSNK